MYEPIWRRPTSVKEALEVLSAEGGRASVIAGGTDLVPRIRCGAEAPPVLVDLGRLESMRGVNENGSGKRPRVEIGALTTHAMLARERAAREGGGSPRAADAEGGSGSGLGLLGAACRTVGGPQIRSRGTLGGNVANASPAGDACTALLALEAGALVVSKSRGERELPLGSLLLGPGITALEPDELITGFSFEEPGADSSSVYLKEGQRNALAIAVTSVALVLDRGRGRLRISLGSVAPTPVRARGAEQLFESEWESCGDRNQLIEAVASLAVESAEPIDDVRSSAGRRRTLVKVLVGRALAEAWR